MREIRLLYESDTDTLGRFTSMSISTPEEGVVSQWGGKVRLSLSFVTRAMFSASPDKVVVTGAGVVALEGASSDSDL